MDQFGGYFKMEAYANISSRLLPSFTEEVARIRKEGDYSQGALENASLSEIVAAHTGIKVVFYVTENLGKNALFKLPSLDNNHPFFTQAGFSNWFGGEAGVTNLDKNTPLEGSVDIKNYKVSGIFTQIEVSIAIGYALIKDKSYDDAMIAEILAHEVGHAFDYFRLLGNIVRDSWLISNASKVAISQAAPEVKEKVLIRTKEQLGIEELNYQDLLKTADVNRKDAVELVLVTNSLIKGTTQSKTPLYDARTVEQSADAFVAYHGGGRALAGALVKLNKENNTVATRNAVTYMVCELFKTLVTLFMLYGAPISTIIWLVAIIPGVKLYDSPEARVETLKQQLLGALRQIKDQDEKNRILEEIAAIDIALKELKDRRTFYEAIYDTITPVGRKRYQQEQHQERIKSLLFNDLQAKALTWRNTQ